ncbi:MAG: hypothetical protein E3J72_10130 [Planctomycetota bacterium]|nr:MAG: hypothetical protein E3J72_10130 [Planctomycetota bacterium]
MPDIIHESCNFLINGAWNPAIFTIEWLSENFSSLLANHEFETQMRLGGPSEFRQKVIHKNKEYEVNIYPNPSRLLFQPEQVNEKSLGFIQELSSQIVHTLEHTPLTAAGSNFVYRLTQGERFCANEIERSEKQKETFAIAGLEELTSKKLQYTFSFPEYEINIIYNFLGDSKTLQYNFHYEHKQVLAIENVISDFARSMKFNEKLIKEN